MQIDFLSNLLDVSIQIIIVNVIRLLIFYLQ
jgi:hypothetical protein